MLRPGLPGRRALARYPRARGSRSSLQACVTVRLRGTKRRLADVADDQDNCLAVANADQADEDGDVDNDGIVNVVNLGIFGSRFFSTDPEADFSGDGIVNATDLGLLRSMFLQPPGPSGTAQ